MTFILDNDNEVIKGMLERSVVIYTKHLEAIEAVLLKCIEKTKTELLGWEVDLAEVRVDLDIMAAAGLK
jgi:hypothetical protein